MMTLVIMAAGMGSRYGGLKQIDPVGRHGEFILDYSVYDAVKAGFDKVVFIIKRENLDVFRETVGKRLEKVIPVEYAFQEITEVPEGARVPKDRTKPWGTAHAVWSCRNLVNGPFAVINADDFYGRDAFTLLHDFFMNLPKDTSKYHFCMAGYLLKNTLTENGHVARGICTADDGYLTTVTERTKIQRNQGQTQFYEEDRGWTDIDENSIVSMNCWGFTPDIFREIEAQMREFFADSTDGLAKKEFFLPSVVQELMDTQKCDVKVMDTPAKWYGVTYHEDKEKIVNFIDRMIHEGTYPETLWNEKGE